MVLVHYLPSSPKTESTSVTEKPYVLHQFSGGAVEKNTESYVGTGSLFGFVSSTEATVVKSTSSGLFKIHGSGIEKNTENYVGQGSLFGLYFQVRQLLFNLYNRHYSDLQVQLQTSMSGSINLVITHSLHSVEPHITKELHSIIMKTLLLMSDMRIMV